MLDQRNTFKEITDPVFNKKEAYFSLKLHVKQEIYFLLLLQLILLELFGRTTYSVLRLPLNMSTANDQLAILVEGQQKLQF